MKIIIFSKSTEIYAPLRIVEEALKRGHKATNLHYEDIAVEIGPRDVDILYNKEKLEYPDAVILRVSGAGLRSPLFVYQRVALIDYFPESVFLTNKITYTRWPRLNKLEQHYGMVRAGIPVVPSFSFASDDSIDWNHLKYPLIAKTVFGSSGQGVFKVDSLSQFIQTINEKGVSNLLFQEFLTTGQDYRVIVIGGKAMPLAMRKSAKEGEFRTNYAQGGMVEGVELTSEMKNLAERTAELFKADYAGIDIMYDDKGHAYVLEINRGAQFQGFEESTKLNVAQELIKLVESKVK